MPLLDIRNLTIEFKTGDEWVKAVDRVSMTLTEGEIRGLVGESGSGKSVTMMALMGLLDSNGHIKADRMQFDGQDLLTISERARRRIVGRDIAMIFQDPMTSLNPVFTVGQQIMESLSDPDSSLDPYQAMHIILVTRSLTRVWRRSINIAEQVYFISQGESVKHKGDERGEVARATGDVQSAGMADSASGTSSVSAMHEDADDAADDAADDIAGPEDRA